MSIVSSAEKKFIFLYIILLGLTGFFFSSINLGYWLVLWGVYSLLRFVYLNDTLTKKVPKILNLPSRILFGLNQEKEKYLTSIVQIYTSKFFTVFLLIIVFYLGYHTVKFVIDYKNATDFVAKDILFYQSVSQLVEFLIVFNIIVISLSFHQIISSTFSKIGKNP